MSETEELTLRKILDEMSTLRRRVKDLRIQVRTLQLAMHGLAEQHRVRMDELSPKIIVTRPVEGTELGSEGNRGS